MFDFQVPPEFELRREVIHCVQPIPITGMSASTQCLFLAKSELPNTTIFNTKLFENYYMKNFKEVNDFLLHKGSSLTRILEILPSVIKNAIPLSSLELQIVSDPEENSEFLQLIVKHNGELKNGLQLERYLIKNYIRPLLNKSNKGSFDLRMVKSAF